MNPSSAQIIGVGHATPSLLVSNTAIESELGLETGWIERRTGMRSRRICSPEQSCSTLAIEAGEMALQRAGTRDIALLLLATSTPDYLLPPTGPVVARELGLKCGAIDLAGACAGFLYALGLAESWVRTNQKTALVVAANVLSRRLDPSDAGARAVFGDGAGAVVIAPGSDGILSVHLGSDGTHANAIRVQAGGSVRPFDTAAAEAGLQFLRIEDGQTVFVEAVEGLVRSSQIAMADAGVETVDRWVPHQANLRILRRAGQRLGIPENRWTLILDEWGNSSAASLPTALSLAFERGEVAAGQTLLFSAVGAGMVEAAAVVRWEMV